MKLLCATSASLILIGICLGQNPQPTPPAKAPSPAPAAAKPAPSPGDVLLDAAWQAMKHRSEIAAAFHEQLHSKGLKYTLQGRYFLQPGNKLLYERHVRMADGEAQVKVVIDGQNYWVAHSFGDTHHAQTFKFADLFQAIDQLSKDELGAEKIEQVRQDARTEFGLSGFEPLFRDLHNRLTITRVEPMMWKAPGQSAEKPIYLLEGTWNKSFHDQLVPAPKAGETRGPTPEELWSNRRVGVNVPRTCRLYLARDGAWPFLSSFWPYRVEWHGPTQNGGADVLLAAIDFEPIPPPSSFALSDDERKDAVQIDPNEWVMARKNRLLQERRLEEERGQRRSLEGR